MGAVIQLAVFISTLMLAADNSSALTIQGVECGGQRCSREQYCSKVSDQCTSCMDICDSKHHNFDAAHCNSECQDFILDFLYRQTVGNFTDYISQQSVDKIKLEASVKDLRAQLKSVIVIVAVLLALLVMIAVFVCGKFLRRHRDKLSLKYLQKKMQFSKNRVKQYPVGMTHQNMHTEPPLPRQAKPELKLEIRDNSQSLQQHQANTSVLKTQAQPLNPRALEKDTTVDDKSQIGAQTPKTISTSISNRHPAEDSTLDYSYDNHGLNLTPSSSATPETKSHF